MNFIITKEQYLAVKTAWASKTHHTASDSIIYNLLRGFPADRGFTPVTNANILSNGGKPWAGYNTAHWVAHRMISIVDTSVETYIKTYGDNVKQSRSWFCLKAQPGIISGLPTYAEEHRQREIAKQKKNIQQFVDTFGIELTPELRTHLLTQIGDSK